MWADRELRAVLAGVLALCRSRTIDQRMDRLRARAALLTQYMRGLAGKGAKDDFAIDMFSEVPGESRLAGTGKTKQPEDLRLAPAIEPFRRGFERIILLGGPFHSVHLPLFRNPGKRQPLVFM